MKQVSSLLFNVLLQLWCRYFRVQKKMDTFYKLLVKDSLDREDVEAMEKENIKKSHEIQQMFR